MKKHKSPIKAHRQSLRRHTRNKSIETGIKTLIKKIEVYCLNKNFKEAKSFMSITESTIMKAVTKKVLKLNNASRKVSRLVSKIKSLESSESLKTE